MQVLTKLRQTRERRGLSQRDLSERSGVTQPTISNLEKGRPARFVTMRKLAEALDVEPGELVGAGDAD
jgi:transcriptional regulator with XRE-family HTH domain